MPRNIPRSTSILPFQKDKHSRLPPSLESLISTKNSKIAILRAFWIDPAIRDQEENQPKGQLLALKRRKGMYHHQRRTDPHRKRAGQPLKVARNHQEKVPRNRSSKRSLTRKEKKKRKKRQRKLSKRPEQ